MAEHASTACRQVTEVQRPVGGLGERGVIREERHFVVSVEPGRQRGQHVSPVGDGIPGQRQHTSSRDIADVGGHESSTANGGAGQRDKSATLVTREQRSFAGGAAEEHSRRAAVDHE